jgi:hypothetical protein
MVYFYKYDQYTGSSVSREAAGSTSQHASLVQCIYGFGFGEASDEAYLFGAIF